MKDARVSDLVGQLEAIFLDLMQEDKVPVRSRSRVNCAGWDSLFQLHLILAIEQEFHITLSDEDMVDLNSFDCALKIIQEHVLLKDGCDGRIL